MVVDKPASKTIQKLAFVIFSCSGPDETTHFHFVIMLMHMRIRIDKILYKKGVSKKKRISKQTAVVLLLYPNYKMVHYYLIIPCKTQRATKKRSIVVRR